MCKRKNVHMICTFPQRLQNLWGVSSLFNESVREELISAQPPSHPPLPPLLRCPGKPALPLGGKEQGGEAEHRERKDFFISPKHDCSLPSCYYGYYLTSELVSTETAIVGADTPQVCPGAFINNKKCWPSVKNVPTWGRLLFPYYSFSVCSQTFKLGHRTGSAMENH